MELTTKEDLRSLLAVRRSPCISIYLPTHRAGPDVRQDPIRLKNLLTDAEKRAVEAGLRAPEAAELIEPARRLLADAHFWRYQGDGLALFVAPGFFSSYRLPLTFEELVVMTNRFHVKPLLQLFTGNGRFLVLTLSQNNVRLFEGTLQRIMELELEGVPTSLAEALKYDDPEKQLQLHTASTGGGGDQPGIFHGHGVGIDDTKTNILRFFHKVCKGLNDVLRNESVPLVLAGVDFLFPIFREASSYPYITEKGIAGNPDELSPEALHERTIPIVEPLFLKAREEAVARYNQFRGSDRTSEDVRNVVPAAHGGRVECLFVAVGVQQWGKYEPATGLVTFSEESEQAGEDLMDLAAVQTYLNGGTVYAVKPGELPGETLVAALYRY
ncbi:MAG: hypothetical protein ACM3ON_01700 [Chloroflexota bacterium]